MSTDIKVQNAPIKLATTDSTSGDYDVTAEDLEILESRIEEVERYLGI